MEQMFLLVHPWREVPADTAPSMALHSQLPVPGTLFLISAQGARIGRLRECEVSLRELAVSNEHARITYENEAFWIVDCGSRNGTLLNGAPVRRAQEGGWKTRLCDGDRLAVGLRMDLEVIVDGARQQAILDAYQAYYAAAFPAQHETTNTANPAEPATTTTTTTGSDSTPDTNASGGNDDHDNDSDGESVHSAASAVDALRSLLSKRSASERRAEQQRKRQYRDRAQERRREADTASGEEVSGAWGHERTSTGDTSENRDLPPPPPPPPAASLQTPLDAKNIGFQLLQRMGWKVGSGLGALQSGMCIVVSYLGW